MSTPTLAIGRRKTATASAKITPGTGQFKVNGRILDDYFTTARMREVALASITAVNLHKDFDVEVRAKGGGLNGQASATRHAMARALIRINPEHRPKLKSLGYLTRDPREKERKKPGQPGARKRFQFSKR